ncbi:MAG: TMEM165/GDT1 family protein [bacterium]|nr:TMEM165/GDT1 family protein [bacterium]MDD5756841.1 TMEM165/GDT1 family protein [bacterium]
MAALLKTLLLIFIAELGDKTQLLVLSFAAKYKPRVVFLAVITSTILLYLLAIAVGSVIGNIIPMQYLKWIVSLAFIGFGVWTLLEKEEDEEAKKISKFGPFLTVALAFFLAEMGDKTQLAAISLTSEMPRSAFYILAGAVIGMILADGLAILIGTVLHKKLPGKAIKISAGIIFIGFGLFNLLAY